MKEQQVVLPSRTDRPCTVCGLEDGSVFLYGGVPMHETYGRCIMALKDDRDHYKDALAAHKRALAKVGELWRKTFPNKPEPRGLLNIVYLTEALADTNRALLRVTKEKEGLTDKLDEARRVARNKERRYKRQEMLVELMRETAQGALLESRLLDPKDIIYTFRRADLALEAEEDQPQEQAA